jgi:hypothetical protein
LRRSAVLDIADRPLDATGDRAALLSLETSPVFDAYMAIKRETVGRAGWHVWLLPHPHTPSCAAFEEALKRLSRKDRAHLERHLAGNGSARDLPPTIQSVSAAMQVVDGASRLGPVALRADPVRSLRLEDALGVAGRRFANAPDAVVSRYLENLGTDAPRFAVRILLVPSSPFNEPCGLLAGSEPVTGFVNYGRFRGADLVEAVLCMVGQALMHRSAYRALPATEIAYRLTGDRDQRLRFLRSIAYMMSLVAAAETVRAHFDPGHVDMAERLGVYLSWSGLAGVIRPIWTRFMRGELSRDEATAAIVAALSGQEHVIVTQRNSAVLAADFYLLELMTAEGDAVAANRFARFERDLAAELAAYLHCAVGGELAHCQAEYIEHCAPDLKTFIATVNDGESGLAWPAVFTAYGIRSLDLAERAFALRSRHGSGNQWCAVARLLRMYLDGQLPSRVFVDQCFSTRHNNGPVLDKLYDTSRIMSVLDAQAAGDVGTLLAHASTEVRRMWARKTYLERHRQGHDACWLGVQPEHTADDIRRWEVSYGWSARDMRVC